MTSTDPRKIAYEVLSRVEQGAYSDLALDAALDRARGLDPRDRGLVTELVYGVLRHRNRLDFALARCSSQPLSRLESAVLQLLRLGAYQLLCLDRVPERAAVHTSVELARHLGLERVTGYINGALRALVRKRSEIPWPSADEPLACLENTFSLPPWLASRWLAEMGPAEALALGEAMLEQPPFTVRVNTLKTDRDAFLAALERAGHGARPCRFAPEGVVVDRRGTGPLPGDESGWYQVQDQASMLIPRLLAPGPGERLLDACAAPGGKTTQLAALTGNEARIVALDKHPQRADLVRRGALRLGCRGIEARAWDLEFAPTFLPTGSIDRALVDAPCSGLGVLRRNPETRWSRGDEDPGRLAGLQGVILGQVAPLVRPGGVLLYAVCTLTPEETTGAVEAFLATHPEFLRDDLRETAPEGWAELMDAEGCLRTFPHRHDGMDAFFAARFRRRG